MFLLNYWNFIMFAAYSRPEENDDKESEGSTKEPISLPNLSFQYNTFQPDERSVESAIKSGSGKPTDKGEQASAVSINEYNNKKIANKSEYGDIKCEHKRSRKEKECSKSKQHSSRKEITQSMNIPARILPKGIVFSNGHHLRPDQSFYMDCDGDKNNLAFPTLYYKTVPR